LKAPVDIVLPEVTPLEVDLSYPEHPIKVLYQKDRVMRSKMIKFFKVQWSNNTEEETTWESEDFLHSCYIGFILPWRGNVRLFAVLVEPVILQKSQVEISVRGEGCDAPGVTVATIVLNSVSLGTIEA
jgi:hypothetical protein